MKKLLMTLSMLAIASSAYAVPSLGVGSSSGYYNATDAYQTYWGGGSITAAPSEDGFLIGASGSKLHVWSNITNADIYILTTNDVKTGNNITFDTHINEYLDTGTFRSYTPTPYWGINLGKVDAAWGELPKDPFAPNPPQFYSKDVVVAYDGTIGFDQWIFAAADSNGLAGLQAKSTDVYTESNGYAGIQTTSGEYWVETNGLPGIQPTKEKTGTPGHWVWIDADNKVTYRADDFTTVQADDSSMKTTSARGGGDGGGGGGGGNQVPEPGTFILVGAGLAGLALYRRKTSK